MQEQLTFEAGGSNANSYAIIAKLATGGMADIFLARTESGAGVERYVVLKRVLRHRATDIKFVHMFLDEARLAAQLQHPNIAQVFDTGKLGESYFFTMEYVHGETVRELLHRAYAVGQPIPIGCALTIVSGAAAGLQHAHDRVGLDGKPLGIVHRDVSPSNLMINYEGNVKLIDFGVAKATLQSTETQSGTVKGKIGYMAPEQCRGGKVDPRCDLFSLGIVMWELLVGERLFKRATEYESMEAIVIEPTPPPSSKRPEIPPSVDAIVLKLLAKQPADRFQTADELLEAIETAAIGAGIAVSQPALKRFVKELFGQRPEPWVEMRIRDAAPEVVTISGVALDKSETAELQLERVLDLSSPNIKVEGSGSGQKRIPRAEGSDQSMSAPSSRFPRAPTAPTVTGPVVANARPSSRSVAVATPSVSLPIAETSSEEPVEDELPPRRGRMVAIGIGVIAIGVVIGIVAFAMTGGKKEPVATAPDTVGTAPPKVDPPKVDPPKVDPPKPDLATLSRDGKFADVVARCKAEPGLVASDAMTCALAACKEHDQATARGWAVAIKGTEHDTLATACAENGVALVDKKQQTIRRDPPRQTLPPPPKKDPPPPPPKKDPPPPPPKKDPPKPKCDPTDPMSCRR